MNLKKIIKKSIQMILMVFFYNYYISIHNIKKKNTIIY